MPFINRIGKSFLRLLVSIILIVLISFIPSIYQITVDIWDYNLELNPSEYTDNIKLYFTNLVDNNNIGYYGDFWGHNSKQIKREISWDIFYYFKITFFTFIPGLVLGITLGITAVFFTLLLNQKWKKIIEFFSFFIISLPDFFIIIMLQFLIITIYKETEIKLFAVATGGTSTAIFLPILTISIFPFFYMYRVTLNSFEDVFSNRYIQTAYSKGLSKIKVLWSHVSKNGLIIALNNIPSIIVPTLSNLFIVELLFNTHGLTNLVYSNIGNTSVLIASVFLIWLMVEAVLVLNELLLNRLTKHRREECA